MGYRIFLTILSLYSYFAMAIDAKAEFEQRAQAIVWDQDTIDITVPCDIDEPTSNMKSLKHRSSASPLMIQQTSRQLLRSLGIHSELTLNVVSAYQGEASAPVFFLFPEFHLQSSPSKKTEALHKSRAIDMIKITSELLKSDRKLINFNEGPLSTEFSKGLPTPPENLDSAAVWATQMLEAFGMTGAVAIGEAFPLKVKTAYNDSNDLWLRWVLTVFALDKKNWKDAQSSLMVENSRVQLAKMNLEDYRSFYAELSKMKTNQLKKKYSELCESRSRKMAQVSFDSAKAEKARVVYMSFGVVHTYGIVEELKRAGASYVIFSPN